MLLNSSINMSRDKDSMSLQRFSQIQTMEEDDKFFIKFFLIDDSLNLNQWKVTEEAVKRDLQTFVGTPFVITSNFDHPTPEAQESERDGTITKVGFDENTGKAFAIAEIHDQESMELIKTGRVSFVSPSISVGAHDFIMVQGREIATKFRGEHVAGVQEPAFGKVKAQIKGQCSGTENQCDTQLHRVQAKTDILEANKANIKLFNISALKEFIAQEPCMENCIQAKQDAGIPIDDQAIAICLNECGQSKEGSGNQAFDLINSSINTNSLYKRTMTDSSQKQTISAQEECPPGQEMVDGQCVESAKTVQASPCTEAKLKDYGAKIANLEKLNQELTAKLDHETKKPVIDRIITAKTALGTLKEEESATYSESLFNKDVDYLNEIVKEYEAVVSSKKQVETTPYIRYKVASVQKGNSYDDIVSNYKRVIA